MSWGAMSGTFSRSWWRGTWLVAERGILDSVRPRSFKIVTGVILVVAVAAAVLPGILGSGSPTYTLATVGRAPAALMTAVDVAATQGDYRVRYVTRDDEAAVRDAVREGDAHVGLAGDTEYVASEGAGTFPAVVSRAVVALARTQWLLHAGLTREQLAQLQAVQPPRQVSVGKVSDDRRAFVGFGTGLVLFMALLLAGSVIATAVGTEKSSRISEVVLATLRPGQSLVGTVLAAGAVTLFQLLVLAAPLAVSSAAGGRFALPAGTAGDLGLGIVWFLLGFWLYAFVFAASASLVDKVTEISSATTPVTLFLTAAYIAAGWSLVLGGPNNGWSVVVSMTPFTAPVAMPIRWAMGDVPAYQLVVAMLLTAATAWLVAALASTLYHRALVITGHRVRAREVVSRKKHKVAVS